jgi:hypothetical protein
MSHASWLVPPCMTATGARPGKKSNHSSRSTPTERQHDARPCVRRSAGERPLACRAPPRKASHLAAKKKQAAFHVAFCVRFVPTRTTPPPSLLDFASGAPPSSCNNLSPDNAHAHAGTVITHFRRHGVATSGRRCCSTGECAVQPPFGRKTRFAPLKNPFASVTDTTHTQTWARARHVFRRRARRRQRNGKLFLGTSHRRLTLRWR